MRLTDLQVGEKARIINTDHMNELVQRRLLDLGIMDGTLISIKRNLPLGGPVAVETKGQLIGLRRREAKLIQVEQV